jgi:hypothetical protein
MEWEKHADGVEMVRNGIIVGKLKSGISFKI